MCWDDINGSSNTSDRESMNVINDSKINYILRMPLTMMAMKMVIETTKLATMIQC